MLIRRSAFRRLILLIAVIGSLAARLPAKASNTYAYLSQFGSQGANKGQFNAPAGIAADGYGNIYVVDFTNQTVQRFDRYGNFLTKFSISGTSKAVAVDLEGNLFIADITNNRVQKFDGNGRLLLSFGSAGNGNGQFNAPAGVAVSATGEVFVSDTGNNRIEKFDSYGNYLLQFGSSAPSVGNGNGQFNGPRKLAVDADGNVFVPDTVNNRVQKFDNYGNYLTQWGSTAPNYLAGSGSGQFNHPFAVTIDGSGHVYVADQGNARIQKFDNSGAYLTQFGGSGFGNPAFTTLSGIAVDVSGHVFASDFTSDIVEVFAQTPTTSASFTPSSYTGGTLNLSVSNGSGATTALTVDGITRTSPYTVHGGTPHIAIFQSTDQSGNIEDSQVFYFSAAPFAFSVTPDLITPVPSGSGFTTFTVSGAGFDSTSRITINGTPITTTQAGSGASGQQTLIASIPNSYFKTAGNAGVTVTYGTPATLTTDDLIVLVGKVSLALSAVLSTDANGNAIVALTLKNTGTVDATSLQINGSSAIQPTTLNGSSYTATTFPTSTPYATVPTGSSYNGTLTFPAAGLTTAAKVPIKVHGTFASGTFSSTIDLAVPLTVSNVSLSRDASNNVVATLSFTNNSGASVSGAKIKGATLTDPTSATTASPLTTVPVAIGPIAAHGTSALTLTFPAAVGNAQDTATLTLNGTYINFSSGVVLP